METWMSKVACVMRIAQRRESSRKTAEGFFDKSDKSEQKDSATFGWLVRLAQKTTPSQLSFDSRVLNPTRHRRSHFHLETRARLDERVSVSPLDRCDSYLGAA